MITELRVELRREVGCGWVSWSWWLDTPGGVVCGLGYGSPASALRAAGRWLGSRGRWPN